MVAMCEDPELQFVAGNVDDAALPKEKLYLLKYFKTHIQREFLKYYLLFGNFANFVNHTGCHCGKRWPYYMRDKLEQLEAVHAQAKDNFDLDTLLLIESGKYKLSTGLADKDDI
jgi:hypothetical protein